MLIQGPLSTSDTSNDVGGFLRQNIFNHLPMHIRQPHVAAAEAVGLFFVIDAAAVEHGQRMCVAANGQERRSVASP